MWEPVQLPDLPGRVLAVSEFTGDRFVVWTSDGVFVLKVDTAKPSRPARLLEQISPRRVSERFDSGTGCLLWRALRYQMHGECGPGGAAVGGPLPGEQRSGQRVERAGDRLLVRDIAGTLRQAIDGLGPAGEWSAAGFSGYAGNYLLVACPESVRLFRFAGSDHGAGALWQRAGEPGQQRAFLRAIADSPDDAPRLTYADWLEEHGDPDRAEFIRLQCRIAERERSEEVRFGDPELGRADDLVEANEERWVAEMPALPGVTYWFRGAFRGFPTVTFRNPDDLVRHGQHILEATPLEAVQFHKLPRLPLSRLLKTPLPERVCWLRIRNLPADAEPGLAEWLTSPRARRLRRLHVYNCASWSAVVRTVAASQQLGCLEEVKKVEPGGPAPDQEAVLALARSSHLPQLRVVSHAFWHQFPEPVKAELLRRFPAIPLK